MVDLGAPHRGGSLGHEAVCRPYHSVHIGMAFHLKWKKVEFLRPSKFVVGNIWV